MSEQCLRWLWSLVERSAHTGNHPAKNLIFYRGQGCVQGRILLFYISSHQRYLFVFLNKRNIRAGWTSHPDWKTQKNKWLSCLAKRLQLSSKNLSRRSSRRSLHHHQLLLLLLLRIQLRLQLLLLHRRSLLVANPQPRRSASPSGLWSSPGTAGMTRWSCRWRRRLSRSWRRARSWCGSRRAGWTSPSCWADRGCTSCCPPRRWWWEWRAPGSSRRSGRMWRTGKWVKGPAECAHIPTHTPTQHHRAHEQCPVMCWGFKPSAAECTDWFVHWRPASWWSSILAKTCSWIIQLLQRNREKATVFTLHFTQRFTQKCKLSPAKAVCSSSVFHGTDIFQTL